MTALLSAFVAAFWGIVARFSAMFVRIMWKIITFFVSVVTTQAFHAFLQNNPDEAAKLWEKITTTFFEADPVWLEAVGKYMRSLTGFEVDVSDITTGLFTSGEAL